MGSKNASKKDTQKNFESMIIGAFENCSNQRHFHKANTDKLQNEMKETMENNHDEVINLTSQYFQADSNGVIYVPFFMALATLNHSAPGSIRIARQGWNGKNMWLSFVSSDNYQVKKLTDKNKLELAPYIGMKTADNKFVPWSASQSDLLANDWYIIKNDVVTISDLVPNSNQ